MKTKNKKRHHNINIFSTPLLQVQLPPFHLSSYFILPEHPNELIPGGLWGSRCSIFSILCSVS